MADAQAIEQEGDSMSTYNFEQSAKALTEALSKTPPLTETSLANARKGSRMSDCV